MSRLDARPPSARIPRDHLTLRAEYLPWLRDGRKTTTIRYRPAALEYPLAHVLPLYGLALDGTRRPEGNVRVLGFAYRRFGALGADDARRDGFSGVPSMRGGLRGIYPGLADGSWVTVYEIEPAGGAG